MSKPIWIELETIIKIHDRQLSEHGGLSGVRDEKLLASALARPQNLHSYDKANMFEMSASLAHGIVKNHPFIDGNKRTAYVACRLLLELNSYRLVASTTDKIKAMLDLAAGELSQEEFAKWLEVNCEKV